MEVTICMVNTVLQTLPIGYYIGRRVKCELTATNTSYYNPITDTINIGFNPLKKILEREFANKSKVSIEFMVRGLLYHELSHVMLTPKNLFAKCNSKTKDIVNIFEDERIETVNADYFLNTNFKELLIIYNDDTNPNKVELNTARNKFFDLVRFRRGPKEYLNRVQHIVEEYAGITPQTDYWTVNNYVDAILELYRDFEKEFNKNNPDRDQDPSEGYDGQTSVYIIVDDSTESDNSDDTEDDNTKSSSTSSSTAETNDSDNTEDSEDSEDDSSESNSSSSSTSSESDEDNEDSFESVGGTATETEDGSEEENDTDSKSIGIKLNDEPNDESKEDDKSLGSHEEIDPDLKDQIKKMLESMNIKPLNNSKNIVKKALKDSINTFYDQAITNKLDTIITQKLKKKKLNGAAINSYSGVFNPRNVVRDDYKWWSQSNRNGHIRQFSKVHFNLFIDNSGSFRNNEKAMNTFLQSLNRINNPDFDFDIITINTEINEWDKMYYFECSGGNVLDEKIAPVVKRHQKNNCNNYNIVLFDGDAHSDQSYHYPASSKDAFRYFDMANTIIISDDDNEKYLKASVHSARVKITKNYYEEFINSIFELLEVVL